MTKPEQQEDICPLCGADNQCAMAADAAADSCWCQGITVNPASLAAIPAESAGKRCLCPACSRLRGEADIER